MKRLKFVFLILCLIIENTSSDYVNPKQTRPQRVRYYPKRSVFRKVDLIDRGCRVFLDDCPATYKYKLVCARDYDGTFQNFGNYCEMEFENCNGWRKWSMVKQDRC